MKPMHGMAFRLGLEEAFVDSTLLFHFILLYLFFQMIDR